MRGKLTAPSLVFGSFLIFMFSLSAHAQATATYVETDGGTEGTWHGSYGADGYSIPNASQSIPAYVSFAVQNQANYTWAATTTDPRALQTGAGSGRTATCWYNSSSFNFDVNVTDGASHQFSIYALDWDQNGRAESIQVLDASTHAVLDTRAISSFSNGLYLIWNISGHVEVTVTRTAGSNAVISGVFWDPVGSYPVIPNISSLSPANGAVATSVTITGTNFGSTQGTSSVTFNGSTATVSSWSNTSIVVPVPSGATSGPVIVTEGGRQSNGVTFAVNPGITSIVPAAGGVNTFVIISGTSFGASIGSSTVTFNGVAANPTSWSPTTIVVPAPANTTTGPVVVTVGGNASNGVNFTYSSTGAVSGAITRASDGSSVNGATVQVLQSGIVQSSTTTSGAGAYLFGSLAPGVYDLQVTASGFSTAVQSANLVVAGQTTTINVALTTPNIASLSPSAGPVGTTVAIVGSGFGAMQPSNSVTFNGTAASASSWTNTRIATSVPSGATSGNVVVTVGGAASNGVSFAVGTGGIAGTITRTSDGTAVSGAFVEALLSNVTKGSNTSGSDGSYTISNLSPGTYDVRVTTSGYGTAIQTGISVPVGSPTTANVSLSAAGTISGTVTMTDGVTPISGASIAVLESTDTAGSSTTDANGNYSIATITPGSYSVQASASGFNSQTQNGVSVTAGNTTTTNFNLNGQSFVSYSYDALGRLVGVSDSRSNTAVYSYDAVGNLTAIGVNPSSQVSIINFLPQAGSAGNSVTVNGTGFGSTPSSNTVSFNGTSATVSSASATQIVVTVPSGATNGPITVTAPSGSATSAKNFTVTASAAPTISGFTPSIGTPGTALTINGANFDLTPANDRTKINVLPASVSSATPTTISTSVPTGATSGHISLATPTGSVATSAYFFVPPPPNSVASVGFTGSIAPGNSVNVALGTAGQIGLLVFDGIRGEVVSLAATNNTYACDAMTFTILNPDGSSLASTAACGGGGSLNNKTLPTTGTYTVYVNPTSSTGAATFTLTQNITESLALGTPLNISSSLAGQVYDLTFSGTAGEVVSVAVTNNTYQCDTMTFTIVNPNGSNLASSYACGGGGSLNNEALPATGTYTVYVNPTSSTGAATFTLTQNIIESLALNTPLSVSGALAGQVYDLTFSGTAGEVVSVVATNSTYACDATTFTILNPDGSSLAHSNVCGAVGWLNNETLPATGTYTVYVNPTYSTGGASFTLTQNIVESLALGTPLSISSTLAGQVYDLTFSGTAGEVVSVAATNSTYACDAMTFTILNPDGSSLAQFNICGAAGSLNNETLPATGTYTVYVNPTYSTGGATFTLTQNSGELLFPQAPQSMTPMLALFCNPRNRRACSLPVRNGADPEGFGIFLAGLDLGAIEL